LIPDLAPWQRRVARAAGWTLPGILVRLTGGGVSYPLQLAAYGAAVVAAAFLLAWACEAAQVDIAHGVVVAVVAFVAILPEFIVELHFAFTGAVTYTTANLTGASRLLLGAAIALPAAMAIARRTGHGRGGPRVELAPAHRVELAVLCVAGLWALRPVVRGEVDVVDGIVLIGCYATYLRRVGAAGGEGAEPMGVAAALAALPRGERRRWVARLMTFAAAVILLTAVPFGDAVLGTGALVGISPYLLLQWIVPVATETPELVIAGVLLAHARGGESVAVLLAGAVSQLTLALGSLPLAYVLGAGTGPLPLQPREQVELLLTIGVALYAVASLVTLRLSRGDSSIMLALFAAQFLLPGVVTRLVFAVLFWAVALDVLVAERRRVAPLVRALRQPAASARRSAARTSRP
jgi:cation:H+ antiporter